MSDDADQIDRVSPERHRNPHYQVFECETLAAPQDEHDIDAWVQIGVAIPAATDRKAIEAVVGTPENPVEGFDAARRLLPHAAVLVAQWHVRTKTPNKVEPTAEERAELERQRDVIEKRLAGTVSEDWDG